MRLDSPDGSSRPVNTGYIDVVSQDQESDTYWRAYEVLSGQQKEIRLTNSYDDYIYHLLGFRVTTVDDVAYKLFLNRLTRSEGWVAVNQQYEFIFPSLYRYLLAKNDYCLITIYNTTADAHTFGITYYFNKYLKPEGWVMRPVASFTADDYTVGVGVTVTFTDASTNVPTSWAWTFGDGSVSYVQNPTHVYSAPGTYNVLLVVRNVGGESAYQASVVVT